MQRLSVKKNGRCSGSGSASAAPKKGGARAPNPKGGVRVPNHDAPFDPENGLTTAIHLPNSTVGQAEYARQLACSLCVPVSLYNAEWIYLNLAFDGKEARSIKISSRRREEEALVRDRFKADIKSLILNTARFKAMQSRVDPSDKFDLQYALASALLPHKLPARALSALACNAPIIDLFMSSPCATDEQILIRMEALRGTPHGYMPLRPLPSTSEADMVPLCYNLDTDADAADFESMVAEHDRIEYEADCHELDLTALHLCSLAPKLLLTEPAAAAVLLDEETYNALAHPMMPPMGTYYYNTPTPPTAYDMTIIPPYHDDGSAEPVWTSQEATLTVMEHMWDVYGHSERPSLTSHEVATLARMLAVDLKGRRA